MKEMKKYPISRTLLLKQLLLTIFTGLFRFIFSSGIGYAFSKRKDDHFNFNFPKSMYFDLFSIINIKIFRKNKRIHLFKNTGLFTVREILDSDIWVDEWSGNVDDILDIVIEAKKDSLPEFCGVSDTFDDRVSPYVADIEERVEGAKQSELKLYVPRCVFFLMKDGTKMCVAVFYRLKVAQYIVSQMKEDFLDIRTEYYENTTDFVERFGATKGNESTTKSRHKEIGLFFYPFFEWFGFCLFLFLSILLWIYSGKTFYA